jgi:hypothetical protein
MNGTPTLAGWLAAAGNTSIAISASQVGHITLRFESRLYPLIAANLALGGGSALLLFAPLFWMAVFAVATTGTGVGITLSAYRSIITGLAPDPLSGSLVSLGEACSRLTLTFTPIDLGTGIAVVTPYTGFQVALRVVVLTVILLASAGSILGLVVAERAESLGFAS